MLLEVNHKKVLGKMTITDLSKIIADKKKLEVVLVLSRSPQMHEKFKNVMAEKDSHTQNEAMSMHADVDSSSMPSRQVVNTPSIILRGSI